MNKILTAILICMPLVAWGDDALDADIAAINAADNETTLKEKTIEALNNLKSRYPDVKDADSIIAPYIQQVESGAVVDTNQSTSTDTAAADTGKGGENSAALQQKVDDAQKKLDDAKAKEQSAANRSLTSLTTAATGLGGMQLAQGLAEKNADSAADKDMDAYIATMRCTYGESKSFKWSSDPIELPGGNDPDFMKYRSEYTALAAELKTIKAGLDLKPGIEAELILDKATSGLYDDENTGITGGHYASRYRAAAGSEKDKKGLNADKKEAKTRMIAGGVVAGVGLVGGVVGNSLINGKLGELIKERKDAKSNTKENDAAITKIKNKMKEYDIRGTDSLDLSKLDVRGLGDKISYVKFDKDKVKDKEAKTLFKTDNTSDFINSFEQALTEDSKKDLENH